MRKLTPIALLAIAATALYWKRRAIEAENRLTARVLAEEKERAEWVKKPDGFWDMFFSDEPSATKPDLSEVLQCIKEANSRGWARTVGSYPTDEELTEELNTCHCEIPEDMDPFMSFACVPDGFNDDVIQYCEALRKVVCRCDSERGDSDE